MSWAPPASGAGPTQITVAIATHTMGGDHVSFDPSWPAAFTPLLTAAEELWEIDANVQFDNVNFDNDANPADVRVGLVDVSAGLNPPRSIQFQAHTWDTASARFRPDCRLGIEDPAVTPVTPLGNGDFQYVGDDATVFQCLVSSLGALLGLGDSPNDPFSVRYSKVTTTNGLPDNADLAAIQAIYGKPPAPLGLSDTDLSFLKGLTAPFFTRSPS